MARAVLDQLRRARQDVVTPIRHATSDLFDVLRRLPVSCVPELLEIVRDGSPALREVTLELIHVFRWEEFGAEPTRSMTQAVREALAASDAPPLGEIATVRAREFLATHASEAPPSDEE